MGGTCGRDEKWVGYVAHMGETCGTYGRDEKWVGHVTHTGETRNGWDMWHIRARREMGGTCGRDEKWVGHVAHMGETRNADRVFVGKYERIGTTWIIQA